MLNNPGDWIQRHEMRRLGRREAKRTEGPAFQLACITIGAVILMAALAQHRER